jgi:hypothetical protein
MPNIRHRQTLQPHDLLDIIMPAFSSMPGWESPGFGELLPGPIRKRE